MNPLPDVHHKMSKKIAQLTKVVYHLNTRNEDNESVIKVLSTRHENEINELHREATSKIEKMKAELTRREDLSNSHDIMNKLKAQHQEEKNLATKEFAAYKANSAQKEHSLVEEFKTKTKNMQRDIELASTSFQNEIKNREQALELLRGKHAEEIRLGNQRYDSLLKEKLNIVEQNRSTLDSTQESLEKEIQRLNRSLKIMEDSIENLKLAHNEEISSCKTIHESEVENLKQSLEKTHGMEFMNLKARHESELQNLETTHESETRKRTTIHETKIQQLQLGEDEQIQNLNIQIQSLVSELEQVNKKTSGLETALAASKIELTESKHESNLEIEGKSRKISSLRSSLNETETELNDLRGKIETEQKKRKLIEGSAKSEVAQLQDQLSLTTEISEERIKTLELALKKSENDARELQEQKTQLILKYDDNIQSIQQSHQEDSLNLTSRINTLQEGISRLEQVHKFATNEFDKAKCILDTDIIQKQETIQKLRLQMSELDQSFKVNISNAKDQHAKEIESLHSMMETIKQSECVNIAEKQKEAQELSKVIIDLKTQLHDTKRLAAADLNSKLQVEKVRMEHLTADHKKQLQGAHDESILNLQILQQKLEEEKSIALAHLENKLKIANNELQVNGAIRVASLEQVIHKLETDRYADIDKFNQELKSKDQDIRQTLDDAKLARKSLEALHAQQLVDLQNGHQETISKSMQELQRSLTSSLTESLTKIHHTEIDSLRCRLTTDYSQLERKMTMNHAQQIADQQRKFQLLQENAMHGQRKAFDESIRKLKEQQVKALEDATLDHEISIRENDTIHMNKLSCWEHKCQVLEIDKGRVEKEFEFTKVQLGEEIDSRQSFEKQVAFEKERNLQIHNTQVESLKTTHKESFDTLVKQHENIVQNLEDKMAIERIDFEERSGQLNQVVLDWEYKYEHRESRPEDVEFISELKYKVQKTENKLHKTLDEMKFFKNELVNREDSYNKMFSASPNVGVMQVIKKEDTKRKSSKKRGVEFPPLIKGGNNDSFHVSEDDRTEIRRPTLPSRRKS